MNAFYGDGEFVVNDFSNLTRFINARPANNIRKNASSDRCKGSKYWRGAISEPGKRDTNSVLRTVFKAYMSFNRWTILYCKEEVRGELCDQNPRRNGNRGISEVVDIWLYKQEGKDGGEAGELRAKGGIRREDKRTDQI